MPVTLSRRLLFVGLLLSQARRSQAQPSVVKLQGFTENLPPLNFDQGQGPQGFAVELLQLMAREAGLTEPAVNVLPWPRAVLQAQSQSGSLLFSLTRTPEREGQYAWVGPIAERRVLLYQLAQSAVPIRQGLDQLQGQRIGAVRDSAAARQLQAAGLGAQLELALDDATNVRKLLARRFEVMALLDWAAAWHMAQHKLPYGSLRPVMELDVGRSYWYGLPPDTDPALLQRLQSALDRLRRDGRYQQLRQRYFR